MKKVIFSAVSITAVLGLFAFAPEKKNSAVDNTVTSEMQGASGRCDTKYETDVTFTKCDKVWTESESALTEQNEVLAKY
jgi:hypothetical protein